MNKYKINVSVEVETKHSIDEVKNGIQRGIYRGLDSEPYNIAPPKNVFISFNEDQNINKEEFIYVYPSDEDIFNLVEEFGSDINVSNNGTKNILKFGYQEGLHTMLEIWKKYKTK